jgi:uroporphyrinogen-III synthase
MRILITRPAADSEEIAARLAALGHEGIVAPLLVPHYQAWPAPGFAGVQAILITSANGVRALVRATNRRDLPIFAVGPQTTAEARNAGFTDVRNADGNAHDLASSAAQWTTPDKGALLHVCSDEAPGTLAGLLEAAGFSVRRAPLYRIEAAERLPEAAADALAAGAVDAALFFSPRSAAVFRNGLLQIDAGLAARLTALCISAETAAALAPLAFAAVRVAARPNQDALLVLVE